MFGYGRNSYRYDQNGYGRYGSEREEPAYEEKQVKVEAYQQSEPKAEEALQIERQRSYDPEEEEDYAAPDEFKGKKPEKDECRCKECEFFEGNSIAFDIRKGDCEIRADILVKKNKVVRVWGRVKDCYDDPVEGALVKLVKIVCWKGKYQYVGVAHTVTDCKGFYQFDVSDKDEKTEYRILVSKAAYGKERIIGGYGSCKVCDCDKCRD